MNIAKILLITTILFITTLANAQTNYYGLTSKGGNNDVGVIYKTNTSGTNIQTAYTFEIENTGKSPAGVPTQATNGKLYGVTTFGGDNISSFQYYGYSRNSGVIYEYDPSNSNYSVLFNFDDTASGCWPKYAPIEASNGLLFGIVNAGGVRNYGTLYSYDRTTSVYTKIHDFKGSYATVGKDGVHPEGELLKAVDGKIYGVTSGGGYNSHGTIFSIDPATSSYTKLLDMQVSYSGTYAGNGPESGLIQAADGMMYGTTSNGGSDNKGNVFKYNPVTNVANSIYEFTNVNMTSQGGYPRGNLIMIGNDSIYGVTYNHINPPGTYTYIPYFYLWRYQISTGNMLVVDSIVNGSFSNKITLMTNGKILLTGNDNNSPSSASFWEYDPATRISTLIDSSSTISTNMGLVEATNGKFYGGFTNVYTDAYSNGLFVEYDKANNTINEKFKFSHPVNGVKPLGDLMMATNGKLYGTTSEGGANNKGVIFEFNPSNDTYIKKFDLDSLSGYRPKDGLMEAANGRFYLLTFMGGISGDGTLIEIDTTNWSMLKKADFSTALGRKPMGKVTQAWDGMLYGLTAYDGGALFQYNIATGTIAKKLDFDNANGSLPYGSLSLSNNGKLYGLTNSGGSNYYSKGTFFEYDPTSNTLVVKNEMFQHLGYKAKGNTPLLATDGKMYMPITNSGGSNSEYEGGTIDAYDGVTLTNKAVFSVSNTGSNPMGDLMEAANGKFYGYTYVGGLNNYGTLFEFDASTNIISKKTDFDQTNGANPIHGSLTEVGLSNISITQQPAISSSCIGDTALFTIAATHTTLLHYQWYKNSVRIPGATNDTLSFNILATDDGVYSCRITGGAKAVYSNNITLTSSIKPVITIGNIASTYCLNNADINLTALPTGGTFSGTGVNASVFSPATAGVGSADIIYSFTNTDGCSNSDTTSVNVYSIPDASFTGFDATYCDNATVATLTPTTTGGTFIGNGINGNTFDPSYYVNSGGLMIFAKVKYEITDANSCYNADSISATIFHKPTVNISGLDTIYCQNAEIDTLVTTPTGGSITAGAFLVGDEFNPANAALGYNNIYYSYTNSNNCTNSDTIKIKINTIPDASFTGLEATYCNNDLTSTLVATEAGGVFTGTTSAMTFDPNEIVIPSTALYVSRSITYVITNTDGCTDSFTNSTTIYPLPNVDFGTLLPTVCNNAAPISLTLGTPVGGTYSGNGVQGILFSAADAPIGNSDLVYSFTNSNNCTNTDIAVIEVLQSPEFTLGNDTTVCINHNITLATKQGSGYLYLWNDGSTDSTLTIDAASLGQGLHTFSVTLTDENNNCVEVDDIVLTIDPCTGIEKSDNNEAKVSVYPNPSSGIFNIDSEIEFETMDVYSTDGRLILSQEVKDNTPNFEINIQNQSKGVYYLLLNNSQTTIHKQLIVK